MDEQTIIDEFNEADSTQKHILIMAHFGRAIYYAQILEQQCVNMLAVHDLVGKEGFTQKDVDEIFDKYDFSKQTLGKVSKMIGEIYNINVEEISELNEVIQLRNHYTHNYFRFNDVLFHSPSGRLRMVKDFFQFTVKAKSIDLRLEAHVSQYNIRHNVTEQKLMSLMQIVKEKWKDQLIDESYDSTKKNN
jgi:hypothetical protein